MAVACALTWILGGASPARAQTSPQLAVSPATLAFGDQRVGTASPGQPVTVANEGTAALTVLDVALAGADADDFGVNGFSGPVVLEPGQSLELAVVFAPLAAGSAAATLQVTSDSPVEPVAAEVALGGTGTRALVSLAPPSLDFGPVPVGEGASEIVTVANPGDAPLTVSALSLATGADFALVEPPALPFAIAPGGARQLELRCAPRLAGDHADTLSVTTDADAGDAAPTVALSCTGTGRALTAAPEALVFAETLVGESADTELVLRNDGGAAVTVTNVVAPVSSVFSLTAPPLPLTLEPGQSAVVGLSFAPMVSTDYADELVIQSSDPAGDLRVPVTGPGRVAQIAATPASHDFGEVRVGGEAAQVVTLQNIGTAAFTIGGISLASGEHFALSGAPVAPATLEPGAGGDGDTLAFTVLARPASVGQVSTRVRVQTDIPGIGVVEVPVSAAGVQPGIALSAAAIDFGVHDVQAQSPLTESLSIANTGTAPLVVSALSLVTEGGDAYPGSAFAITEGAPGTVAEGAELTVELAYQPEVASAGDEAFLRIDSNAGAAVRVPLTGRGIDRSLEIRGGTRLEFPPTYRNPTEPSVARLTLANTGEAPLLLFAVMAEGEHAASFSLPFGSAGRIDPGEEMPVTVVFSPRVVQAEPLTAELVIVSDDDDRPMVRIELSGTAILPEIAVTPGELDFGQAGINVPARLPPVRISNMHAEERFTLRELRVVDAEGRPSSAFRVIAAELPLEIEPMSAVEVEVEVAADRPGVVEGALEIYIESDPEPVSVVALRADVDDIDLRGGGGCRAAGQGGGAGLVLVALAWLGRRRRAWLALVLVAASAAPGLAQPSRDLDLEIARAQPAVRSSFLTLASPRIGAPGSLALDVALGHTFEPLVVESGDMSYAPVASRFGLQLGAAYAVAELVELGVSLPLWAQSGDEARFGGVEPAGGAALGDLAVHGKLRLLELGALSLGTALSATLPTASDQDFAGAAGPTAHAAALGQIELGRVAAGASLGLRVRPEASLGDVEQGSEITLGAAGATPLRDDLSAVGELRGAIGLAGGAAVGSSPFELLVGLRWRASDELALVAGVGRGVVSGIGAPEFRSFVRLHYAIEPAPRPARAATRPATPATPVAPQPQPRPAVAAATEPEPQPEAAGTEPADGDGDGVVDSRDLCAGEPETINGVNDDDGCPDPGDTLVRVTDERIELDQPILFRAGAQLDPRSYNVLGQVAATLRARRDLRRVDLVVAVEGSGEAAEALARERAEALRQWLVDWGIAGARLRAVGRTGAGAPGVSLEL